MNQPGPTTICHTQETSTHLIKATIQRTVNQQAICQSVCSEIGKLINEMTEESKDSQEKVRELLTFTCGVFVMP